MITFTILKTPKNASDPRLTALLLTAATLFFIGGFLLINTSYAEETPLNLILPGATEGEGTHFEITDSEYLNITLDSSETIKLSMESIPEMITMMIDPA
ncbi:MAG: hypothetical protein HZA37_01780, partial [Parcubacteria group bacterium]|nr:hypothetical protein [Parcubacteria group bacterium]